MTETLSHLIEAGRIPRLEFDISKTYPTRLGQVEVRVASPFSLLNSDPTEIDGWVANARKYFPRTSPKDWSHYPAYLLATARDRLGNLVGSAGIGNRPVFNIRSPDPQEESWRKRSVWTFFSNSVPSAFQNHGVGKALMRARFETLSNQEEMMRLLDQLMKLNPAMDGEAYSQAWKQPLAVTEFRDLSFLRHYHRLSKEYGFSSGEVSRRVLGPWSHAIVYHGNGKNGFYILQGEPMTLADGLPTRRDVSKNFEFYGAQSASLVTKMQEDIRELSGQPDPSVSTNAMSVWQGESVDIAHTGLDIAGEIVASSAIQWYDHGIKSDIRDGRDAFDREALAQATAYAETVARIQANNEEAVVSPPDTPHYRGAVELDT